MRELCSKILLICLVATIFVGCRPRGVLSNREMRDLLYDLHRCDGAVQVAGYNYGHNQELASYYQSVLDKHGVTQAQFDSSLVWFTDNPQIFNKIYPQVVARLQADMDREDALRDERVEKRKREKQNKGKKPALSLQDLELVQKDYIYGINIPLKKWQPKENCEKSCIIFGQLEKK